jgi:hypothetical protein
MTTEFPVRHSGIGFTLTLIAAAFAVSVASAKVKIETKRDKSFNFKGARTYTWHPEGAGDVKILQDTKEDPEKVKQQLEPMIRPAVDRELAARGLAAAAAPPADLYVTYYVLIGAGASSQYMGQFLGNVAEWGMPPFPGATQSLEIYEQGSLIVDLVDPKQKAVVWRGIARAEVDRRMDDTARRKRIDDAIKDMLGKLPTK